MDITARQVKELREISGAGMMDCKKALTKTNGNVKAALEYLRVKGVAGADKKASRITAEGIITATINNNKAIVLEINCETDFVARGDDFLNFTNQITQVVLNSDADNINDIFKLSFNGGTVEEARKNLIAKVGENISFRRFEIIYGKNIYSYIHNNRIGVIVKTDIANKELGKSLAMHIAAFNPQAINHGSLDKQFIENEKKVLRKQALESGKPENIIEKMIQGRINKFIAESTLEGQLFVKDNDKTVKQILNENKASVLEFYRCEVGEGVDKKTESFVDEVAAQVASFK